MRINCISCGHMLDIGDSYDDYNGPVKCFVCGVLMEIRTEEGNVRSMAKFGSVPSTLLKIQTEEGNLKSMAIFESAPSTATKATGNRSAKKTSSPPAVKDVMA